MAKYHSEKELFTDRTAIYDEHGRKVGYSEKSLFGDHVNIYDANGKPSSMILGVESLMF